MKVLIEKSVPGHRATLMPTSDVPCCTLNTPQSRQSPLLLPELSEVELVRHYTALSKRVFGVDDGFYPLGSCTMKYNPRVNERVAKLPGFSRIHPLQPPETLTGCTEVLKELRRLLCDITGMDDMTLQPAAGAHGEFAGLLLIKAYHQSQGNSLRTKIIVPDTAHGTNPATVSMAGFSTINILSNTTGRVDLDALRSAVGSDTAGLMLTNPNTLGLFEDDILEITRIVHDAGGLCYYDGANLNAIAGIVRPGDMGFDVIHLNLHKTFSTPHGGGGPGSGPVGCKQALSAFLPNDDPTISRPAHSIGRVKAFYGNFSVLIKAFCYILILGCDGLRETAQQAVLNANYLKTLIEKQYTLAFPGHCMHEFVLTLASLKDQYGVSALDVAKALLDEGMHPPTMYFPLIVQEALMIEPTETESLDTLKEAARIFLSVFDAAVSTPITIQNAPQRAPIKRPDEVTAARTPTLKWKN